MNPPLENSDLESGLTSEEAARRKQEFGSNVLPEGKRQTALSVFFAQLKSPLVYVLVVAGIITLALKDYTDSAVIFLAVAVNTVFGFVQEERAGRALEALKKLIHPQARVVRDGKIMTIEAASLVPGDIVFLSQGDKIPADGSVFDVSRFYASEAILTGESVPVEKNKADTVYMGTIVTAGTAKMVVLLVGKNTEMGKIATSVSKVNEDTPLREQLKGFSKQLSFLVLFLTLLVFVAGLLLGENLVEIFTISVALAVSAIPEGLLVALTVVLAIGMQRILSRKGLVRSLVSAETLGAVTTICVDKTGTLTQGKMCVVNAIGDESAMALQVTVANDMDDPVIIAAWEWGTERISDVKFEEKNHQRMDSIPFSSAERLFASLNKWDDTKRVIFVNGAPEELLKRSNLDDAGKKDLLQRIDLLSQDGKRLIGLARKWAPTTKDELNLDDVKDDLSWVGLLAFSDPIREDVKESLLRTKDAGIKIFVITGDYANTALSVLNQLELNVSTNNVILGEELQDLSDEKLRQRLSSPEVLLFARTKPDQKLRIVEILKEMGEVVAMMGDGVNDAPALSQADIGIVVDEASDVAKESADLVLLDSKFSTIVAAIEEGRGIFDNIRKIILYLMCDAFVEILIVLTALIVRLPLPITAAQILWVNLVSDGFPGLALTVDPKVVGTMRRKPRSPKEPLVSGWMKKLIAIVSLTCAVLTFGTFVYVYKSTGDVLLARSMAFAMVGVNSLFYVFSVKMLQEPFWKEKFLENKWLIGAVVAGLALQLLPFVSEGFRNFFGIKSLGIYWVAVFVLSVLMFFVVEVSKWVLKSHLKNNGNTQ